MKVRNRKIWSILTSVMMVMVLLLSAMPALAADDVVVTILHTNDVHGNQMASDKVIGLATVYNIKEATPDSLLFDCGDSLQGSLLSSMDNGLSIFKMMDAVGYDGMTLGNHEFDYGQTDLLRNINAVDFPVFANNLKGVEVEGSVPQISQDLLNALAEDGYKVYTVAGKKIGVFGVSTTTSSVTVSPALMVGLTLEDPADVALAAVTALEAQNCDIIVCIAHCGSAKSDEDDVASSRRVLKKLGDDHHIDLILDGHDHAYRLGDEAVTVDRGNGRETLIVETGDMSSNVGKVTVTFSDSGKTLVSTAITKADALTYPVKNNSELKTLESTYAQYQVDLQAIKFGTFAQGMYGSAQYDRGITSSGECSILSFIADAQRWHAENFFKGTQYDDDEYVILGVINAGGVRASLAGGVMSTYADWSAILPFGGTPSYIHVDAAMLYQIFENSVSMMYQNADGIQGGGAGRFWHPSGFTVEFDVTKTANQYHEGDNQHEDFGKLLVQGERVTAIYLDADGGKTPLSKSDPRRFVLNVGSYNTTGGDGYFMLKDSLEAAEGKVELITIENTVDNREVMKNYMAELLKQPGNENGIVWPQQDGRFIVKGPYTATGYDFTGHLLTGMSGDAKQTDYDLTKGGTPVDAAEYSAYIDGKLYAKVKTDKDGKFTLKNLPNGPHELVLVGSEEKLVTYLNNHIGVTEVYFEAVVPTKVDDGKFVPDMTLTDSATGIKIEAEAGALPDDATLQVVKLTSGERYENAKTVLEGIGGKFALYDIKILSQGAETQPDGRIKLFLPIPSDFVGELAVYRIEGNQKVLIPGQKEGSFYTILVDHLSEYALVLLDAEVPKTGQSRNLGGVGIVFIFALAVLAASGIKTNRKRKI